MAFTKSCIVNHVASIPLRMFLLRAFCFLGFLWCISCQTMMETTIDMTTTDLPTTEISTLYTTINATTTELLTTNATTTELPTTNATTTELPTTNATTTELPTTNATTTELPTTNATTTELPTTNATTTELPTTNATTTELPTTNATTTELPTTNATTTELLTMNTTMTPNETTTTKTAENDTSLVTSAKPTTDGGASTAVGSTNASSEMTQMSSTPIVVTTIGGGSPLPVLSTSIIALISVAGAFLFIVLLAGLAVLCQRRRRKRRKKRKPRPDRDVRNEAGLSIHRPDSTLGIDMEENKMNTFNTNGKVAGTGYDNSVFMPDDEDEKLTPNGETGKVQANGETKTLPSKASLIITTEMDTPSENKQNGHVNDRDVNTDKIETDEIKTVQNTNDEPITEQKRMNGDVIAPSHVDPGETDPKPEDAPETNNNENKFSPTTDGDSERPESGIPYDFTDLESALGEMNEDMQS